MLGLLGSSAEGNGLPSSPAPAEPALVSRIEMFIAKQRAADSLACIALGHVAETPDHTTCIRERAAQRRAALQGLPRTQPALGRVERREGCGTAAGPGPVMCQDI
ncbi:MAG TPA: hypothetical protein VF342_10140 [Alphaproteobacteria bacterium]